MGFSCFTDPNSQGINRCIIFLFNLAGLVCSALALKLCSHFVGTGLFATNMGDPGLFGQCWDHSVEHWGIIPRTAQATAISLVAFLGVAFLSLSVLLLGLVKSATANKLWKTTRFMYAAAFLSVIVSASTFTAAYFRHDYGNVPSFRIGTSGWLTIVTFLMLLFINCTAWSVPIPAQTVSNYPFFADPKYQRFNRGITTLFTLFGLLFSALSLKLCSHLTLGDWAMGLFGIRYEPGFGHNGCVSFDLSLVKDVSKILTAQRAAIALVVFFALASFGVSVLLVGLVDRATAKYLWVGTRLMYPAAFCSAIVSAQAFSALHAGYFCFNNEFTSSDDKCSIGTSGWLTIVTILMLFYTLCTVWSVPVLSETIMSCYSKEAVVAMAATEQAVPKEGDDDAAPEERIESLEKPSGV